MRVHGLFVVQSFYMIQTILFDLGGVIVPLDFPRLYGQLARYCAVPAAEIPHRIGATGLVPKLESGQISAPSFTAALSAELGLQVPEGGFRDLWSSLFPGHTLLPEALFATLKKRYRVVLLSNTNAIHFEMIRETYPHLSHFHDYVLSHEVGAMKPHPDIYAAAIQAAQCDPQECFYTDDIQAYVDGARQVGIQAFQFQSHEALLGQFDTLGIDYRS